MAPDATDSLQRAEIAAAEVHARLVEMTVDELENDPGEGHGLPASVRFLGECRDLLAGYPTTDELEGSRRVERLQAVVRYLRVESSVWVWRARAELSNRARPGGGAGANGLELVAGILELVLRRQEASGGEWVEILEGVLGLPADDRARLDRELVRTLLRSEDVLGDCPRTQVPPPHAATGLVVSLESLGIFFAHAGLGEEWRKIELRERAGAAIHVRRTPAGDVILVVPAGDEPGRADELLGAVGAAIHELLRPSAAPGAILPELSVLRGAMAWLLQRYADLVGWRVAYAHESIDVAEGNASIAQRSARWRIWWRQLLWHWERALLREPLDDPREALELLQELAGAREECRFAVLRQAATELAAAPALASWTEMIVGENLLMELTHPPLGSVDNPEFGRLVTTLLAQSDHDPWEARLEVLRQRPLTGRLLFPRTAGAAR